MQGRLSLITATATAVSEKLTTQTEHIPALHRCWETVPTQKSNQIQGRFWDCHFCLYFGPGLHWDQAHSQAQNTSKNDDFKNGPVFDLIFVWELLLNTYRRLGCAQFEWSIFLNSRLKLKYSVYITFRYNMKIIITLYRRIITDQRPKICWWLWRGHRPGHCSQVWPDLAVLDRGGEHDQGQVRACSQRGQCGGCGKVLCLTENFMSN